MKSKFEMGVFLRLQMEEVNFRKVIQTSGYMSCIQTQNVLMTRHQLTLKHHA